jgi:cytochrome c553
VHSVNHLWRLAALVIALAPLAAAGADEPWPGRAKAATCVPCHGDAGVSTAPDAPNLAGQPAVYVGQQLRNFRSGKRAHEVMSVIAKPLSDRDIDDLAAWYAAIRIEARPP